MNKLIGKMTVLFAAAVVSLSAKGETDGIWTYSVVAGKATLTGYSGNTSSVTIPATVGDGVAVAALGPGLFNGRTDVTSVSIPSGVKFIGVAAFQGSGLTEAVLPSSVESIGTNAFSCAGFERLEVGSALADAVLAVPEGTRVEVRRGQYGPIRTYNRAIRIVALDGAINTIIDAAMTTNCCALLVDPAVEYKTFVTNVTLLGTDSVTNTYCVGCQTNTVLEGFMLIKSYTEAMEFASAVVGGTLVDCAVMANIAFGGPGGGVSYGNAFGCLIKQNKTYHGAGGGMLNCMFAEDCIFENNMSSSGDGGAAFGVVHVRRCEARGNQGYDGGAFANCHEVENCKLTGNQAKRDGGGTSRCTLVRDTQITGNEAVRNGGGCFGQGGVFMVSNCVVSGNRVTAETGEVKGGGTMNITCLSNCEVTDNTAESGTGDASGGGICGGQMASNCVVRGNRATTASGSAYGGGIFGSLFLADCEITDNVSATGSRAARGGGAYGSNTASRCVIRRNLARADGIIGSWGIAAGGGVFYGTWMDGCIADNEAVGVNGAEGGGAANITASRCEISGNRSRYGGGTYVAQLSECVVSNNMANNGGGGYSTSASGCEIVYNRATLSGGGIYYGNLTNCLVAHNRAEQGGGTCDAGTLDNCIVAHNRAAQWGGSNNKWGRNSTFVLNESDADNSGGPEWGTNNALVWGEKVGGVVQMPKTRLLSVVTNGTEQLPGLVQVGVTTNRVLAGEFQLPLEVAVDAEGNPWWPDSECCDWCGLLDTVQEGVGEQPLNAFTGDLLIVRTDGVLLAVRDDETDGLQLGWMLASYIATAGGDCDLEEMTAGLEFTERTFNYKYWSTRVVPLYGFPVYAPVPCPMVDPWNGDYRLVAGSDAIDAGEATELETDYAGNPRTQGTAPDLGALEAEGGVGTDPGWRRLAVLTEGSGKTDVEAITAETGGTATVTALDCGRPFLGWKIDGEIVSTNRVFAWENATENGAVTAVFGNGDIWVDSARGNDSNGGSKDAPLKTLQAAVLLAATGDTVRAKPGTYDRFTVMGKDIDIIGDEGAAKTIIDAKWEGRCATLGNPNGYYRATNQVATLKGFSLRRGSDPAGSSAAGVLLGHLEDCIIENCGATVGEYAVIINAELTRCIVRGCQADTLYYADSGATAMTNRDTLATGNTVGRLWLAYSGIENRNLTLVNNEVSNRLGRIKGWNCIAWGNGTTNTGYFSGGWNCIEGATPQEATDEEGPIWTDNPEFVDPEHEDWRLSDTSPYVDAGNNEWADSTTDLAGNLRIAGAGVDVGCYEGRVVPCRIRFELDDGLLKLDDSRWECIVGQGDVLQPPEVAAVSGWRFDGWLPGLVATGDTIIRGMSTAVPSDWTAEIHRGRVESDTMWGTGMVHVVDGTVTVAAGATLTIEAGAVVKFAPGAKLVREDGGLIASLGATFTHLYDDEVGGDTLGDGAARVPLSGAYEVELDVAGDGTELHYCEDSLETTPDEEASAENPREIIWMADCVHVLDDNYTVNRDYTLRLKPGTIVKLGAGKSLTVEVGGRLIAEGTLTKPVVITSLRDDAHGGDTNGDGHATEPQAGDWNQIRVLGETRFDHCSILYCSDTRDSGGVEAILGTVEFENSEIAHCKYECVNAHGGSFIARNSAFWDGSLGFGYYGGTNVQAYNCVFQSLTTAIRQSRKLFVNCVFADCVKFTDQNGDRSQYDHCLFWNPGGYGANSCEQVGANGNIWGDPKFADAANGDFHVLEGSACIDAGDGWVAPAMDMFGNARMTLKGEAALGVANGDGEVADIGVHEYNGRYSAGADVDVEPTDIRGLTGAEETMASGSEIGVAWRLENVGAGAYSGTWTDRIKLVDALGMEVVLAEQESTGRIEPGTSKLFWGTFPLPCMTDGEWRLGVEANIDRGILEGTNTENNAFVSTHTVVVENPTVVADGGTLELGAGETKLVRLTGTLDEGDALWVTATAGTGPVKAWGTSGAVPGAERHWTCAGTSGGGALVAVGAIHDAGKTYLLLTNEGEDAMSLALLRDAGGAEMVATGLEREAVTAGPMVAVAMEGVGLAGATALELWKDGELVATGAGLAATSGKASAVFDLSMVETSGEYEVRATDGAGRTATSPTALRVAVIPAAMGRLEFWLVLPETVRDGRMYEGRVWYKNVGNADMEAPVFEVFTKMGNAMVARTANGPLGREGCILTGCGAGRPGIVLRAGESGMVGFYFQSMGEYALGVRWVAAGGAARPEDWLESWAAEEARQTAAEEEAAKQAEEWLATVSERAVAWAASNSIPEVAVSTGSVSGRLTDAESGEPVAGASMRMEAAGSGNIGAEGKTEADGTFVLTNVWPLGTYTLTVEGWGIASGATMTVTGAVTGVELEARRLTRVTGTLTAGGTGVADVSVRAREASGERMVCRSSEGGTFDLGWLGDGTWLVRTGSMEGYSGACATLEIAGEGAAELALEMVPGVRWEGRAVDAESGAGVEGVVIEICESDGTVIQYQTTGEGGFFIMEGAPTGTVNVACAGVEWQVEGGMGEITLETAGDGTATAEVELTKKPLVSAFPREGVSPLAVAFRTTMAAEKLAATSWTWDFDGDGVADSDEESPVWEFTTPGTYGATVTMTCEDGTTVTGRLENAVEVREQLATIYHSDVIVLLEGDEAQSEDWEFSGWDEDAGLLQVRQLAAVPGMALADGVKFIFTVQGEAQYKLKAATGVAGPDGEGVWTVETADAGLTEIYEQVEWSTSTVEIGGMPMPSVRGNGRRGGVCLDGVSGSINEIFREGPFTMTLTGDYKFNCSYNWGVRLGQTFEKTTTEADLTVHFDGQAQTMAKVSLAPVNKTFSAVGSLGGVPVTAGVDLSLEGFTEWGFLGTFGQTFHFHQTATVDENGATMSNELSDNPELQLTMGMEGGIELGFKLWGRADTRVGPLMAFAGTTVTAGFKTGYAAGGYKRAYADHDIEYRVSTGGSLPIDGAVDYLAGKLWDKATSRWLADSPEVRFEKLSALRNAQQSVAELYGTVEKAAAKYVQYAMGEDPACSELQEYGTQLQQAHAEYRKAVLILARRTIAAGVKAQWAEWLDVPLGDLLKPETLQRFIAEGNLPGAGNLTAEELSSMYQLKDIAVQVLHSDVEKKALEKSLAVCNQNGYTAKAQEMRRRIDSLELPETSDKLGTAVFHKAENAVWGGESAGTLKNMPNNLQRVEVKYGDEATQILNGTEEFDLDHTFQNAGYHFVQVQPVYEAFSIQGPGTIVQVQDWDPLQEDFPIVDKAAIDAAADVLGVRGPGVSAKNAWTGLNGDQVPLGLKSMGYLNPLNWDSSGEGKIDDHWKLQMGLSPTSAKSYEDPDGDGLTNWQEYKWGEQDDANPQSMSLKGKQNGPNTASRKATHPMLADTDRGGAADGDELLWGTNPKDPHDDPKPVCTGCAGHNGASLQCVCQSVYGVNHCECKGCSECMPQKHRMLSPVQSCDPNEIVGPLGVGNPETERYVARGEELEYTIYFENKADAVAAAQEIRVEMQLDPQLDWSTFEAGPVVVGATWDDGLAGKANWTSEVAMAVGTFRVRSEVRCDAGTGKVEWYVRAVDPESAPLFWPKDPYAGILPPNDEETHCGEGRVTFRAKVREDAAEGALVVATATITFDYNEPIETEPSWWNTVAAVLYEVTFVDDDGRVLKQATKYTNGTGAAEIVLPATPTKMPSEGCRYAFAGWSPALADVTEDATYTATYTATVRTYTVAFEWHEGASEAEYAYGTAAGDVAVPEDPADYEEDGVLYHFTGWEPASVAEVTGDARYEAQYAAGAAVAQVVGGAVYPSLAGAIAAAPAGGTVVLLAEDGVSFAGGGVVIDKDLVIDGGGFTVRGVSNANLHNVTAGAVAPDVEFDGVEGSNVRGFFVKGGNVTFTNLVLTEFGDADYVNKFGYTPIQTAGGYEGTLTIADVDIDKFNRTAICIRGGTFLISGGSIVANAENRDVETLGKDHFQQPVEIRGGTGTIEGVSVSGGDTWGNNGGGAIVAWSGVTVSNASIDFTGVGIWADYAAVTVTGGETSVAATEKALFVEDGGEIAVAAGDFAGALAVDGVAGSRIVVEGGTFDAPVPAAFAGAGLAPTAVADGSGKYTVRTARTATFDSNGGSAVAPAVVADGEPVAAPDPAPVKEHHSLRAWLLGGAEYDFAAAVTADITLVADWVLDRHTVAFLDEDGTEISSAQYDYGTAAGDIARPADPAKGGGAEVYGFAGWQPEVVAVTEDATYWATYRLLGVAAANGVVVPAAWLEANCPGALGGDGAAALEAMAANGRDTVWQCYVAGLDPNDLGAVYECTAELEMGEPDETGAAEIRAVVLRVVVPPGRVAQLKSAGALTGAVVWTEAAAFTNTTEAAKTESYSDESTNGGIQFYRVLLRLAE